jgi:hypothetical protein
MSNRALTLAAVVVIMGCAQGAADEVTSDAAPSAETGTIDSTVPVTDAGTDAPMIEEAPRDAPPGTIFDVLDDAPCSEGSKTGCKTSCGTVGDSTCTGGEWGKCAPRAGDPCLGLDCLGKGDGYEHTFFKDGDGDGHGDPKSKTQACVAPSGYLTTADDCDDTKKESFPGATEVCDGIDNDCNGKVDDLAKIATFNLAFTAVPPCNTADKASCKQGAHEFCKAKSSCFTGGFGPVELGPTEGAFVCIGDSPLIGDWADVVAAQPGCSSDALASNRVCESAVHRAARGKGYASGILQTHAPSSWKFLGIPAAHAQPFDGLVWSDLTTQHAGCRSGTEESYDCNAASHRFCTTKGFVSGFGPVEYNATNVSVVCVK